MLRRKAQVFLYLTAVFFTGVAWDTTYLHMPSNSAKISCTTEHVLFIFTVSEANCLPIDCSISNHPLFHFHIR